MADLRHLLMCERDFGIVGGRNRYHGVCKIDPLCLCASFCRGSREVPGATADVKQTLPYKVPKLSKIGSIAWFVNQREIAVERKGYERSRCADCLTKRTFKTSRRVIRLKTQGAGQVARRSSAPAQVRVIKKFYPLVFILCSSIEVICHPTASLSNHLLYRLRRDRVEDDHFLLCSRRPDTQFDL
jgi:hypothetical protein